MTGDAWHIHLLLGSLVGVFRGRNHLEKPRLAAGCVVAVNNALSSCPVKGADGHLSHLTGFFGPTLVDQRPCPLDVGSGLGSEQLVPKAFALTAPNALYRRFGVRHWSTSEKSHLWLVFSLSLRRNYN